MCIAKFKEISLDIKFESDTTAGNEQQVRININQGDKNVEQKLFK